MARRFSSRYHPEPMSGLATWSRRLAIFSIITAAVSILVLRFGLLETRPALYTFFGALVVAGLSILLALGGLAAIWQKGSRGLGRIVLALLLDVVLIAYPAYLAYEYRKLPAIHDITTDVIDPPRFEALARLRTGDDTNSAAYPGLYSAERQRAAYPDVAPAEYEIPAQRTFDLAMQLIDKRKWLVIDQRAPQGQRPGRIEAIARTPVMAFQEDIALRITSDGEGSRVDMRSSSRYFSSDIGSNAKRIQSFLSDLKQAADRVTMPKKPVPTNEQVKGPPKR